MTANSTDARGGHDADVVIDDTLVLRITEWSANPTGAESAWGDSGSEGYTNRILGRKDLTLSLTGKFDESRKIYTLFEAGDIVKCVLWEDDADYWALPCALVTSFNIAYNQDTKEVVEWSADMGADGIYYRPGATNAPSETKPTS